MKKTIPAYLIIGVYILLNSVTADTCETEKLFTVGENFAGTNNDFVLCNKGKVEFVYDEVGDFNLYIFYGPRNKLLSLGTTPGIDFAPKTVSISNTCYKDKGDSVTCDQIVYPSIRIPNKNSIINFTNNTGDLITVYSTRSEKNKTDH